MDHENRAGSTMWKLSNTYTIAGGVALFLVTTLWQDALAGEWATYKGGVRRTGTTSEAPAPQLFLQWKYTPTHTPRPAWPAPAEEMPRTHSDNAYHVAVVDGKVFFGTSVTNKVYCIDTASGAVRWTFFTEGPIRFAPSVYRGRVYFGSDDGYVYCLDAGKGTLIWRYRAGPSDEKVIGNGRMISLWPVRTSVLIDNDQVLFGAGVFPYEGIYICALNADDGSVIWRNDTIGDRSHELDFEGISPMAYLVASKETLFVPSGRAMPVAFDRRTGKFLFAASASGKRGGAWALLDDNILIAGVDRAGNNEPSVPFKAGYDAQTGRLLGEAFSWFPGIDIALTRNDSYVVTREGIYGLDRRSYSEAVQRADKLKNESKQLETELAELREKLDGADDKTRAVIDEGIESLTNKVRAFAQEGEKEKNTSFRWRYTGKGFCAVILAGDLVIAGGDGLVVGLDAQSGKELWKETVDGKAVGLAVSDGRLVVSTDEGPVYCFGPQKVAAVKEIKTDVNPNPYPPDHLTKTYEDAAVRFLEDSGINKGYCLVLDCGEGRLAYEIARQSELKIIALEKDLVKLATARGRLEAAGLLGSRIAVEPWDLSTLPDYFANLVVSDGMLVTGKTATSFEEAKRVTRPYGGTLYSGPKEGSVTDRSKFVRGELEGAGSWTHQYADPQNTACSRDELVNGPLGILWFGEPGPIGMVERHGRAQSPVSINGRLFVEGEELIMAVDAFNGTLLWKRQIPGAVRVKIKGDSGNLAVTDDGLYVAAHDRCYRLDPATGKTIQVYDLPQTSGEVTRRWGYIAVLDGVLYGSAAMPMDQEYAAFLKASVENGKWKSIDQIPLEHRGAYEEYTKLYPVPGEDVLRALQRSGMSHQYMAPFPRGGEFSQKGAVTEGLMVGDKVFAIDTETGKVLWTHSGDRIANITVVLGDGKIYFAESKISDEQRKKALEEKRLLIETGVYRERKGILDELHDKKAELAQLERSGQEFRRRPIDYQIESLEAELFKDEQEEGSLDYEDADVRLVVALDARTGGQCWRKLVDLTGCSGDKMGAAYQDGVLLFFGNHGNHDAWRFIADGLKWRRITALSADNGDVAWSRPLNYRTRPVIVGNKVIIEPRACDLYTGEIIMRNHPVTAEKVPWEFLRPGHTCGITAASANGLFYRSSTTAFYDLAEDRGVTLFGGYRPGCAISVIPAGGLLLSPEASAGCTCSYPIRCSLALTRKPKRTQPWTVFITSGALTPAKHFAINLGAPADMKDNEGTLWFAYPNPRTVYAKNHFPNYGVKFDLQDTVLEDMGYYRHDFKGVKIDGTDKPWLFTSGCRGLLRCNVPLIDSAAGEAPGRYTVRLGFMAPARDQAGQRVFDVKIQDKIVLSDFDIAIETGGANKAVVKEFKGVHVSDSLAIELIPKAQTAAANQAPILNFIEAVSEHVGTMARAHPEEPL